MKNGTILGQKSALMEELWPLEVFRCAMASTNFMRMFSRFLRRNKLEMRSE